MPQPVLTTLASFNGVNGATPYGSLVADAKGNLYGTTGYGGPNGDSTVFEILDNTSSIITLASFTGPNGVDPAGNLIADAQGNLYGTTSAGGATNNAGTVFEIVKSTNSLITLASFAGPDGYDPTGSLIADAQGNLYGNTYSGGASDNGTVFEFRAGTQSIITLASFNGTNGSVLRGSLIADVQGNLYGTTLFGGASGNGTAFEIPNGTHNVITLASFTGPDGSASVGGLIADSQGDLYGTTYSGGTTGYGSVFEIAKGSKTVTTLANFIGNNGSHPTGSLIADAQGDLYGTTTDDSLHGAGTVFEVVAGTYTITTLASFTGSNGSTPYGNLIANTQGNLYGTTAFGGASGDGTVFEITNSGFVMPLPIVTLAAGPQTVIVTSGKTYVGGGGPDQFDVAAALLGSATIDGGTSGKNAIHVTGGGIATMGAGITDIQAVRLAGGGTPTNFTANDTPGLVITSSTANDVVHDGNGSDTVYVQSATATVYGGSGNDTFYVTAATIGAAIHGGIGHNSLGVKDFGTETMGADITGMSETHLMGGVAGTIGFNFTANATQNLVIVGSKSNDTIHVGDASQTVYMLGQTTTVTATAATASAKVQAVGTGNVATLDIAGGGTATLNGNDGHGLFVVLDAATHLNLGTAAFMTVTAKTAGSTLVAGQYQQTLVSTAGGDTFVVYSGGSDTFQGTKAGLSGDTITGLTANDKIDVTDLLPTATVKFTQTTAAQGTLNIGSSSLTLTGSYKPSGFHMVTDNHSGTLISYS